MCLTTYIVILDDPVDCLIHEDKGVVPGVVPPVGLHCDQVPLQSHPHFIVLLPIRNKK